MNILLIDPLPELERAFREEGHAVKVLRPGGGVFHLPGLLAREGFSPDLLLQQEVLGVRSYFGGLERFSCPTIFWALDTHLNMFWHQWYARLFDIVLTPHISLFEKLPAHLRPGQLFRFAWPGEKRAFIPHAQRPHRLGLCARITPHRSIRKWMVELLSSKELELKDGLSHEEMMAFYDASRVVPNESIANEVNFRLMEGASSGSLLLSPDVGEDQNALLEPGKEFFVYRDGIELLELVAWAGGHPAAVERMGRLAMLRIQADHLPRQRTRQIMCGLSEWTQTRLTGTAGALAFWLTLALQIRNGVLGLEPLPHAREGLALVQAVKNTVNPGSEALFLAGQAMAQIFCLFAEGTPEPRAPQLAHSLCRDILTHMDGKKERPDRRDTTVEDVLLLNPELLGVASAFALNEGRADMARLFWMKNMQPSERAAPESVVELCAGWAGVYENTGRTFNAGFSCNPAKGFLPECALSWLIYGRYTVPDTLVYFAPRFHSLLADKPEYLSLYIAHLAEHCVAVPDNWRWQEEYGLVSIKVCRVAEGLHELQEAGCGARRQGCERFFWGKLNSWRPGERNWEQWLEVPDA